MLAWPLSPDPQSLGRYVAVTSKTIGGNIYYFPNGLGMAMENITLQTDVNTKMIWAGAHDFRQLQGTKRQW